MKLDSKDRNVGFLEAYILQYIGDYAKYNKLPFVRCVRELQECFRMYPEDPSMKNELAHNHQLFVAVMCIQIEREIFSWPDCPYTHPEELHAIADLLDELPDIALEMWGVASNALEENAM